MKICEYGCGRRARYTITSRNKNCCEQFFNKCPGFRLKNSSGMKKAYREGRKKIVKNFLKNQNWSKGKIAYFDNRVKSKYTPETVFIKNSFVASTVVKKILVALNVAEKCKLCGISEWAGKKLNLELDHINGNNRDNTRSNLRFLCPNCHSLTKNYKGRNRGKQKYYSDKEVLAALKKCNYNRRQTLIYLGLTPKGGNYTRLNNLLAQ